MIRLAVRVSCLTLVLLGAAAPASAQVVHSIGFGAGLFWPRGESSRVEGDVLVANLNQPLIPNVSPPSTTSLEYEINDFRSFPVYGEYNLTFGKVEASFGFAYSQRKVDSRYRDLVNEARGFTDIEQDLSLRMMPFTAVVRFLPLSNAAGFQPYVGGGLTVINFRYSESGEFVDPSDPNNLEIFHETYVATGNAVGGVILGGIRIPMGGDVYGFQVEARYQFASGDTSGVGLLGDKIDLSGTNITAGFIIRF